MNARVTFLTAQSGCEGKRKRRVRIAESCMSFPKTRFRIGQMGKVVFVLVRRRGAVETRHCGQGSGRRCLCVVRSFGQRVHYHWRNSETIEGGRSRGSAQMTGVEIHGCHEEISKGNHGSRGLRETSLTIEAGSFVCLMGPSGSGKSTLLNLIAGIDRPSSGQVMVDGRDIAKLSEGALAAWRNHTIGFIFQTFNLIPVLTAFENVELPLLLTKLSKSERRSHVETALNLVGLGDRMTHYPAAAFRWSGTAGCHCSRHRDGSGTDSCGRTDGRSGCAVRR